MRNKASNIVWGLVLIAIGVGIAGDIMDLWVFRVFFSGWWTLFIIIPCFVSIIQNGISFGATTGFIIGVMALVSHYINLKIEWWELIIPAILIIIGLRIIFQGFYRRTIRVNQNIEVENNFKRYERREHSAIFAGNKIRVTDEFYGTTLNAIFGGMSLDLRDAIINSDVEISATAVFGGIDIYIPSGVKVKVNNVPIFGGVSNKALQSNDPNAYTIYLNSTTLFGGIDIK